MAMRSKYKTFPIVAALFSVIGLAGCQSGNTNTTPANTNKAPAALPSPVASASQMSTPWVNIPGLANKTPEEIEKMAGKATQTSIVSEPPQEVPGEMRTYDLADMKHALSVRFYKGKAVAFTITVPAQRAFKTPEEIGKMAGFDLADKPPAKATEYVSLWNGEFGKVRFAEVTIGKGPKSDYNLVRARIQQ